MFGRRLRHHHQLDVVLHGEHARRAEHEALAVEVDGGYAGPHIAVHHDAVVAERSLIDDVALLRPGEDGDIHVRCAVICGITTHMAQSDLVPSQPSIGGVFEHPRRKGMVLVILIEPPAAIDRVVLIFFPGVCDRRARSGELPVVHPQLELIAVVGGAGGPDKLAEAVSVQIGDLHLDRRHGGPFPAMNGEGLHSERAAVNVADQGVAVQRADAHIDVGAFVADARGIRVDIDQLVDAVVVDVAGGNTDAVMLEEAAAVSHILRIVDTTPNITFLIGVVHTVYLKLVGAALIGAVAVDQRIVKGDLVASVAVKVTLSHADAVRGFHLRKPARNTAAGDENTADVVVAVYVGYDDLAGIVLHPLIKGFAVDKQHLYPRFVGVLHICEDIVRITVAVPVRGDDVVRGVLIKRGGVFPRTVGVEGEMI